MQVTFASIIARTTALLIQIGAAPAADVEKASPTNLQDKASASRGAFAVALCPYPMIPSLPNSTLDPRSSAAI